MSKWTRGLIFFLVGGFVGLLGWWMYQQFGDVEAGFYRSEVKRLESGIRAKESTIAKAKLEREKYRADAENAEQRAEGMAYELEKIKASIKPGGAVQQEVEALPPTEAVKETQRIIQDPGVRQASVEVVFTPLAFRKNLVVLRLYEEVTRALAWSEAWNALLGQALQSRKAEIVLLEQQLVAQDGIIKDERETRQVEVKKAKSAQRKALLFGAAFGALLAFLFGRG